jgi:hypothetical protein
LFIPKNLFAAHSLSGPVIPFLTWTNLSSGFDLNSKPITGELFVIETSNLDFQKTPSLGISFIPGEI